MSFDRKYSVTIVIIAVNVVKNSHERVGEPDFVCARCHTRGVDTIG